MVQYLFEGAEIIADLLENFKEKAPILLEKIDECILAFHNLDFSKILSKLATSFKETLLSASKSSLIEIAYFGGIFIGYVIELTIEIVVGLIFTGGTLSVEAVLTKLGETFKAFANLVTGAIKGAYKIGEKSVKALMAGFDWLIEFLSKGTDEIIRIIDEVFAKLKQTIDDVRKLDWMSSGLFKFGNDGATFRNYIKLQQRADDGWYNILCHGDPKRVIINGKN